jgi:hypothetical protein
MAKTKNSLVAQVVAFIAGANKHFPNGSQQLQVGGATRAIASSSTKRH